MAEVWVYAQDIIEQLRQVPATSWFIIAAALLFWLVRVWMRRSKAHKEREAEDWPLIEGLVQRTDVQYTSASYGNQQQAKAVITYSYCYGQGREEEYYSSEFSRLFPDESAAWVWLRALKEKRIPVRVQHDRPRSAVVLVSDIDARFGQPAPDGTPGQGLQVVSTPGARLPRELRSPTEIAAWLAALCFCLSLADHLFRLLAGRPLHPQLSVVLWATALLIGVPFWYWFQGKTGVSIISWSGKRDNGPFWLRICRYLLDTYVALNWAVKAFQLDRVFHLHWNELRLDPFTNGVMLALLFGNAAAALYAALERIEDPSNPSSWMVHSE